jgi:hypothetical protein
VAEQAVFHEIPLARSARVVAHRHLQAVPVGQPLQPPLPLPGPTAVAPAAVRQDQQLPRAPIALAAAPHPPTRHGIGREVRRIRRRPDHDVPPVRQHVVQPVGRRPANSVRQEIVGVDLVGGVHPCPPAVAEVADQLLLLGVHAEDRQPLRAEPLDERFDVPELPVPVGVVRPGEPLDVDPQVVAQLAQQVGHSRGAGRVAQRRQPVAEVAEAAADEHVVGHGVAAAGRFGEPLQVVEDGRIFFSPGGRPAPG